MFLGSVLSALINPYVILVAIMVGSLNRNPAAIWVGAVVGGVVYRLSALPSLYVPSNGLIVAFALLTGSLASFFWSAFGNRVLRPILDDKLGKKAVK
jgi:hypothetical protein